MSSSSRVGFDSSAAIRPETVVELEQGELVTATAILPGSSSHSMVVFNEF